MCLKLSSWKTGARTHGMSGDSLLKTGGAAHTDFLDRGLELGHARADPAREMQVTHVQQQGVRVYLFRYAFHIHCFAHKSTFKCCSPHHYHRGNWK